VVYKALGGTLRMDLARTFFELWLRMAFIELWLRMKGKHVAFFELWLGMVGGTSVSV